MSETETGYLPKHRENVQSSTSTTAKNRIVLGSERRDASLFILRIGSVFACQHGINIRV